MDDLMSDSGETMDPAESVVLGPAVDPLVGREVGGYVIEVALGEGGMDLVYQARHPFLGRRFAIKVLRPEFAANQQLSTNFVREAQTLSGLKHPHIIDIVGFGPLDGQRQYMVMEFLDGRTLEAELAEHGALPVHRVLSLADEILDGLEAAHSIDVIHRDLKPSNVFLAKVSGGAQVVKLLDFGLAKLQPSSLAADPGTSPSLRSTIAGTPDYIAPEQALGAGVSKLSDLYSFGVMLFEMLVGRKLFAPKFMSLDPIFDLLEHHLHSEPEKLGAAFPEDLDRLVGELLDKDPNKRPQSVQLVRLRLRRIAKDLQREQTRQVVNPLLAQSVPELDVKALRRRSRAWPVVAMLGVVVSLATGVWMTREEVPTSPSTPLGMNGEGPPPVSPERPSTPLGMNGEGPPPASPELPSTPLEMNGLVDDELEPLGAIAKKKAKKVAAPLPVETGCEPTDRWRTASRAHMQELQQLAASRGTSAAWQRFEDVEGSLTSAIGTAATPTECGAVERRIQQLAKELTR